MSDFIAKHIIFEIPFNSICYIQNVCLVLNQKRKYEMFAAPGPIAN